MENKYKSVVAFFISLLIMFSIILVSGLAFFKSVVLNDGTYLKVLEREGTYDKIYNNINENIEYLLVSNNIPSDTLNGMITKDEVVETINYYIFYTVGYMKKEQGEIVELDMSSYRDRVDEKMNKFIRDNNLYGDTALLTHLDQFKQTVLDIIESDLQLVNLNEMSKSSLMMRVASLSSILNNSKLIVMSIGVVAVICLSMCLVWRKRKLRRFVWIGYSFVSSGLIMFLVGISGIMSGFYNYEKDMIKKLKN